MATAHDPRGKVFIAKLNDLYPVNQTWNQLIDLANEQEANLDRDSDEVRQAIRSIDGHSGFCTSSRRSCSSNQCTNDRDHCDEKSD